MKIVGYIHGSLVGFSSPNLESADHAHLSPFDKNHSLQWPSWHHYGLLVYIYTYTVALFLPLSTGMHSYVQLSVFMKTLPPIQTPYLPTDLYTTLPMALTAHVQH